MRLAALLLVLAAAGSAHAHALGVEARLRGDRVEIEAYYSDNTPAREARVSIHDSADRVIAEGRTDDRGRWAFAAPLPGRYTVIVDAGAGHRKSVGVTIPNQSVEGQAISEGPPREEFTRFPWERVAIGLAIIAALAIGWLVVRRRLRAFTS